MAEIALGLPLGGDLAVDCVILRESVRGVAFEARREIRFAPPVMIVRGHHRGGALGSHQEEDEDPGAHGQEDKGLESFAHTDCLTFNVES